MKASWDPAGLQLGSQPALCSLGPLGPEPHLAPSQALVLPDLLMHFPPQTDVTLFEEEPPGVPWTQHL